MLFWALFSYKKDKSSGFIGSKAIETNMRGKLYNLWVCKSSTNKIAKKLR